MAQRNDAVAALAELADVLRQIGATPVVRAAGVAPATIYDLHYRVAIVSCAFNVHARGDNGRRIRSSKLKLLQFIAMRPWLLTMVREWAAIRGEAHRSALTSERLRRGFIGDAVHDRVIELLTAARILSYSGDHLELGVRGDYIHAVHDEITKSDLFATEREVLNELKAVRITNEMLEGW